MEAGLHTVLLVGTDEVGGELCVETFLGMNRPKGHVHEPSLGWPGQGYREVACHDCAVTTRSYDGGDVDLQDFDGFDVPLYFSSRWGQNLGGQATVRR